MVRLKKTIAETPPPLLSSEHEEQAAFFEWLEWHSEKDPRFKAAFAIPNVAHLAKKIKLS